MRLRHFMAHITRDSLMTLEAYARARAEFRARVMAHKKHRTIALGEHVTLIFEDELTIRYQIQEMLRAERIFEESGHTGASSTPTIRWFPTAATGRRP